MIVVIIGSTIILVPSRKKNDRISDKGYSLIYMINYEYRI